MEEIINGMAVGFKKRNPYHIVHVIFSNKKRNRLKLSRQKIKKNSSCKQCTSKPNNNQTSQRLPELGLGKEPPLFRRKRGLPAWRHENWIKLSFVALSSREGQRASANATFLNDGDLEMPPLPQPTTANPRKRESLFMTPDQWISQVSAFIHHYRVWQYRLLPLLLSATSTFNCKFMGINLPVQLNSAIFIWRVPSLRKGNNSSFWFHFDSLPFFFSP